MQEVFEKIIEKLEKEKSSYFLTIANTGNEHLDSVYEKVGDSIDKAIEIVKQAAADYSNGWIPVECGEADTEPVKDCEIWVTRKNCFGDVWVQKCPYYVGDGFWDGVIAWKPLEEKPEPYQSKGE